MTPQNECEILTSHLTKKYGNFTAVDDLSLIVKKGEIYGLLGPNGAGKTTAIKMLSKIVKPSSGYATVFGEKIPDGDIAAKIGYMPQETGVYLGLTVEQNLKFYGRIFGLENKEIEKREDRLLKFVDLLDWKNEMAENLSGVRLLFLDAGDASLVRRFSETRRPHPLAREGRTVEEAIAEERALLAPIAEMAHRIDTSSHTPVQLRQWVHDLLVLDDSRLVVCVESFGFKGGIPLDADFVFDARFLPNPHYDPHLRHMTGQDADVATFLEQQTEAQAFLDDIHGFIGRWLPRFARDRRAALTVAIGCTGGRHRSVGLHRAKPLEHPR